MLHHNDGSSIIACLHLERPVLHVLLHDLIVELPSDESLGIKDGVVRILGHLVLGRISDEPLSFREGDIRRGGPVSLIVGDDLNPVVLPNSNTGVGGSQVDSHSFA